MAGSMEECGQKGITHVVIESGGFSEYSHGHHTLEEDVLAVARKYGMKVIGPNCVGVINFDYKMMMPFAFAKEVPSGGTLGLITQSGGVGSSYLRTVAGFGITAGKFVSIGNKLQLDEADFLEYLIQDPETRCIALYLEGFKRGRQFFDLARNCDKPIILQKSNRSPESAKIAQSHTTALSGLTGVKELVARYEKPVSLAMISDREEILDLQKKQPFPVFVSPRNLQRHLHSAGAGDACGS